MNKLNNTEEALTWLAEIFEAPPESIRSDTPRDKVEAWDSLGMLTLMARLDEDLEIILDEDQIAALKTIGDVVKVIGAQGRLD
jgi:acyl carrier protein